MDEDIKMIRFINSDYNTLFFVPDGGNIVISRSDGEKITAVCTFLDAYHTQIGKEHGRGEIYHICQFAEIMERNGHQYAPEKPPALPDTCFSILPSTGEMIRIDKGKKGYLPCGGGYPEQNRMDADRRNDHLGVTRQQEAAMLGGSMFGWATPAARISSYDFQGKAVAPAQRVKKAITKEPER